MIFKALSPRDYQGQVCYLTKSDSYTHYKEGRSRGTMGHCLPRRRRGTSLGDVSEWLWGGPEESGDWFWTAYYFWGGIRRNGDKLGIGCSSEAKAAQQLLSPSDRWKEQSGSGALLTRKQHSLREGTCMLFYSCYLSQGATMFPVNFAVFFSSVCPPSPMNSKSWLFFFFSVPANSPILDVFDSFNEMDMVRCMHCTFQLIFSPADV